MEHILLVEDDKNLGDSLKSFLKNESYQVTLATNISQANENISDKFSMIILDWMLPDGQGVDFLRELRSQKITTPIILLTAKNELIDKVMGLESGANDYMTKPFEPRELLARIRVQLRNPAPAEEIQIMSETIELPDLSINLSSRTVIYKNQEIELTKMEFDLLTLMAQTPDRAFSREELLNKVWGFENFPTTRTVDTHVLQLRQKLSNDLFQTIRGIGYKLTIS
jgi:DNA-binding response OmpR family regulator